MINVNFLYRASIFMPALFLLFNKKGEYKLGQYWKTINLSTGEFAEGISLKLTETSWIGNSYMARICNLLLPDEFWHMTRLICVGDYCTHVEGIEKYADMYMDAVPLNRLRLTKEEKEALDRYPNLYTIAEVFGEDLSPNDEKDKTRVRYIYNHTKKEFVNLRNCPKDSDGAAMHPLPLLLAVGNGLGGGDYFGFRSGKRMITPGKKYIGYWAGDCLSSSTAKIKTYSTYTEICPGFREWPKTKKEKMNEK